MEAKIRKLEEATSIAQSALQEKESKSSSTSTALSEAKAKLKALSPDAQANLQVNETELPDLISANMIAQEEYDEAKKRYETNQRYLLIFKEKVARANSS